MTGHYRMYRGWMENPALTSGREPFCRRAAWVWMIEEAAWQDRKVNIAGKTVALRRGQFSHSLRFLAAAWGWSVAGVRRFIDRLETDTMIGTDSGTGQVVVTICNYEKYQAVFDTTGTASGTASGTLPAQERHTSGTNEKEVKEVREEIANAISISRAAKPKTDPFEDVDFADWYKAYPLKKDPGRAAKAYRAARKIASAADLLGGALRYAAECDGTEARFIKHPTTWLNAMAWMNEPAPGGRNGEQRNNHQARHADDTERRRAGLLGGIAGRLAG